MGTQRIGTTDVRFPALFGVFLEDGWPKSLGRTRGEGDQMENLKSLTGRDTQSVTVPDLVIWFANAYTIQMDMWRKPLRRKKRSREIARLWMYTCQRIFLLDEGSIKFAKAKFWVKWGGIRSQLRGF